MERILCVGNFVGEICAPRKLGKMCMSGNCIRNNILVTNKLRTSIDLSANILKNIVIKIQRPIINIINNIL